MISGRSSVAFVVRLKSISLPSSSARRRAYAIVDFSTGKFNSVSPPKNVRCAMRLLSASRNSTLCFAVSSLMNFDCLPCSVSTILSSPYS